MLNKEKKVQPTSESGNAAKPIVSGALLLSKLFDEAKLKDEDGMPVVHYVEKPNGGGIAYLRYDAVVKKLNAMLEQ